MSITGALLIYSVAISTYACDAMVASVHSLPAAFEYQSKHTAATQTGGWSVRAWSTPTEVTWLARPFNPDFNLGMKDFYPRTDLYCPILSMSLLKMAKWSFSLGTLRTLLKIPRSIKSYLYSAAPSGLLMRQPSTSLKYLWRTRITSLVEKHVILLSLSTYPNEKRQPEV